MEKPNDAYGPENLIRYHTALAFVDHLQAEGFIGMADREAMYALIAQRYTNYIICRNHGCVRLTSQDIL